MARDGVRSFVEGPDGRLAQSGADIGAADHGPR